MRKYMAARAKAAAAARARVELKFGQRVIAKQQTINAQLRKTERFVRERTLILAAACIHADARMCSLHALHVAKSKLWP